MVPFLILKNRKKGKERAIMKGSSRSPPEKAEE